MLLEHQVPTKRSSRLESELGATLFDYTISVAVSVSILAGGIYFAQQVMLARMDKIIEATLNDDICDPRAQKPDCFYPD